MPGAKRRLKKAMQSTSDSSPGSTSLAPPISSGNSSVSPSPSPSNDKGSDEYHSHHLHIPFLHHNSNKDKEKSRTMSNGEEPSAGESNSEIANDPANYLSDKQLEEDLEVEQMMDRKDSIGTGDHRKEAGIEDLNRNMRNMKSPSASIDSGIDEEGGVGYSGPGNVNVPPPIGAAAVPPTRGGGGPTHNVTAEQLVGGSGAAGGGGGKKKSSKQRFAERQARKKENWMNSLPPEDPSWTASLEKERQDEIKVITEACDVLGREIYEIAPDGHCMFNAIADQLHLLGLVPGHEIKEPHWIRGQAAEYMLAHPDDFMPFLPSINGEDSAGATDDGMMTEKGFHQYCKLVAQTGEWGGEPEIQALSRKFRIPIHVIQRGPPTVVSHGGASDEFGGVMTPEQSAKQGDNIVRISYHKRMYGLGEHYNSLRKVVA